MPVSEETKKLFEQEERAYWKQREELLERFPGKWVAVVDGEVVAVGDESGRTLREAIQKTGSRVGYLARVGAENEVERIRRVTSGYFDRTYRRAIPRVPAAVSHVIDPTSADIDFVVDTGADLTLLRKPVGDTLGLWDSAWRTAFVSGVGSAPTSRQLYAVTIRIDDHDVIVAVDCRDDLDEDILGRDVINEHTLTVCNKRDDVRLEWADDGQP